MTAETLKIVGDTLDKIGRLIKGELPPGRIHRVSGGVTVRLDGNTLTVKGGSKKFMLDVEAARQLARKDGRNVG